MKKIVGILLLLMLALTFCACGGGSDEPSMESETVQSFLTHLYAQEYNEALGYVSTESGVGIDGTVLENIYNSTAGVCGEFQGINGIVKSNVKYYLDTLGIPESQADRSMLDYDIYYSSLSFENEELGIFFIVEPDSELIYGLSVSGSENDDGYHSHGGTIHKHTNN